MLSILLFTFLLKVSTAFIAVPTWVWSLISGVIILLYGLTLVFPTQRERIQATLPQFTPSKKSPWRAGDVVLWLSLGPIFATCSPTYALLLGTVLPVDLVTGVAGMIAYVIGFGWLLYLLVLGGRSVIKHLYGLADSHGSFKRMLGIILTITGILILTGGMKRLEAKLVQIVPDIWQIETMFFPVDKNADIIDTNNQNAINTGRADNGNAKSISLQSGAYRDYDPTTIPQTGDIVLFFHADRCPTCQQAEANFLRDWLPVWLTILKVDYDTEQALKTKYRVLTQTSFVLIKPDGTMIKRRVWGRTVSDILAKIAEAKQEKNTNLTQPTSVAEPSGQRATMYVAWWCFWCMEGPFEAQEGVVEVIAGYAGGDAWDATYDKVSSGRTKHREAVKIVYDPVLTSYQTLLDTYWRQIDPTDAGGQFADRGSQYMTAIYYQTSEEKSLAQTSKDKLTASKVFSAPIAVSILPFSSFYPAEDYHQDYYKKNTDHYNRYKKWSWREDFVKQNEQKLPPTATQAVTPKTDEPDISHLTAMQRKILFEWGTEPPFDNAYWDFHGIGIYVDVIDGTPLFSSLDKFDSGTGRPSFTRPIDEALLGSKTDTKLGMERTEIVSSSSSGHLGHVFDDGPTDQWGKRYCINSAALRFVSLEEMGKDVRYEKYTVLFEGK